MQEADGKNHFWTQQFLIYVAAGIAPQCLPVVINRVLEKPTYHTVVQDLTGTFLDSFDRSFEDPRDLSTATTRHWSLENTSGHRSDEVLPYLPYSTVRIPEF